MIVFFITCLSFIYFFKYSLPLKPLPFWACETRLLSLFSWKDLSAFLLSAKSLENCFAFSLTLLRPEKMAAMAKRPLSGHNENVEISGSVSLLDLPELALECILERLSPDGVCMMACVCTDLRDKCLSDHLWERHMTQKWGRIVGSAAYREWQWHIASRNDSVCHHESVKGRGFAGYLSFLRPFWLSRSSFNKNDGKRKTSQLPVDSLAYFYRAIETSKFWFPAQVYNRENGHAGFILSCYDAELSYDSSSDTFQARYPPHGRRAVAIESGITWDRIRAPPVDTSAHDLLVCDCLNELRPKDHIEIQWRINKDFPFGWWYGVVGHLETCDGNDSYCGCHESDTLVLEFNQYSRGSEWRRMYINRRDHGEQGNEADGFYGGIRKLCSGDEISQWKQFWPEEVLE